MDFKQYDKKPRKENRFLIVAAICLLLIGGASWFTLSQLSTNENNVTDNDFSSYNKESSSYNNNISSKEESITESVAQPVESQPYSSQEKTTSQKVKSFSMPVEGKIIKDYSDKQLQYSSTYGDMRIHLGIDISCKKGESVSSCSNGKVLSVEENTNLGTVITIDHENGLKIKYSSIDKVCVKSGDVVETGDIIGIVGTVTEECADESHIHIEAFKNDKSIPLSEIIKMN